MRAAIRLGLALLALTGGQLCAQAQIKVIDIVGREVALPGPAKRILLEAPNYFPALSLLRKDAAELVVGIGGTRTGPLSDAERALADKPVLGWIINQTFSVEKALALKPDLMIAGSAAASPQHSALHAAFASAGIPVIYVDFFLDPAKNTIPSFDILGRALGEEGRARHFADFHRGHETAIFDRIAKADPASRKILFDSPRPGMPCCIALGSAGMTAYLEKLRAINIAVGKVPSVFGQLGLEYVIESAPDVIVAFDSGGPNSMLGQPPSAKRAAAALEKLRAEPGFSAIAAVNKRRMHALDESFSRSPLNIVTLELLAKWVHPELFADLDPQATLDEINRRFLSAPLAGPFWASLDPAADGKRP